jgi:nitrite reductase (NADH) small subunit
MSKKWVRITQCQNIPLREGRAVRVEGRDIAIFNLGERFLAVDNRCPHKGGPLSEGIVSGSTVICPLHAWKLSLETGQGVSAASASSCVQTFPTRVEDGIVSIEIPAEAEMEMEEIPGIRIDHSELISECETDALASN